MNKTAMLEGLISHYTGGNKAKFAKLIGVSAQTISAWITRNTFDAELIYAKCICVNPHWLLTGSGPMLISDNNKASLEVIGDANINNSKVVNGTDTINRLISLVESKDKQIEAKDKQIGTLLDIVTKNHNGRG